MASRKLTALPTATEVTTSDKIYIVDVSDTTESPQGTSKQAVISELPSPTIPSGLFTPTFTELTAGNTDSVTPYSNFSYIKIGNIVTVSGYFNAIGLEGFASINFQIVLPDAIKPNNNFSDFYEVRSVLQQTNDFAKGSITIIGNVGNKNLFAGLTTDIDPAVFDIVFTCTYSVDN